MPNTIRAMVINSSFTDRCLFSHAVSAPTMANPNAWVGLLWVMASCKKPTAIPATAPCHTGRLTLQHTTQINGQSGVTPASTIPGSRTQLPKTQAIAEIAVTNQLLTRTSGAKLLEFPPKGWVNSLLKGSILWRERGFADGLEAINQPPFQAIEWC